MPVENERKFVLKDGTRLKTVAGTELTLHTSGGTLKVASATTTAHVTRTDIDARNGNQWSRIDALTLQPGQYWVSVETFGSYLGAYELRLEVSGSLSLAGHRRYQQRLNDLQNQLLRLRIKGECQQAPEAAELEQLTARSEDPLIAQVAQQLQQRLGRESDPDSDEASRIRARRQNAAPAIPHGQNLKQAAKTRA